MDYPSLLQIKQEYPHFATMIHLSRFNDHQIISREIVDIAWNKVTEAWDEFDINSSSPTHIFKKCGNNKSTKPQD